MRTKKLKIALEITAPFRSKQFCLYTVFDRYALKQKLSNRDWA